MHIGYEESLGIAIPRSQFKETIEDLDLIFEEINKLEADKKKLVNKKTTDNKKDLRMGELIINKNKRKTDDVGNFNINYKSWFTDKGNLNNIINKKLINKNITEFNDIRGFSGANDKKINEIIILGDLKHEFAGNLGQEWKEVLDLLSYLKEKCRKITLIKGNHDNYLINVIKNEENVKLVDYYVKGCYCFVHGNKFFPEILDKKIKTIFLGHMHPAISIRKHAKEEKYKCFLAGKWKGKEVVILPSFFPLVEGSDVSMEDTNLASEFNFKISGFEVYVPAGIEVLEFGELKDVGRLV